MHYFVYLFFNIVANVVITEICCCFLLCLKVDLTRSFQFRNSGKTYVGIPVMAANMDTVGTFAIAKEMARVSDKQKPTLPHPASSIAHIHCL
jgi:hypothetical protein